jgi:hypothetical protein
MRVLLDENLPNRYKAVVTTQARVLADNRLDQKPAISGPQPKVSLFTVSG